MVEWKFKSCPRCRGDIFVDKETDEWYEQCLQCGYLRAVLNTAEVPHSDEEEEIVPTAGV